MFLKVFDAFLKFDLPKARFLNFPQNSTPSLIGPFLIIGDCVYRSVKIKILIAWQKKAYIRQNKKRTEYEYEYDV